MLTVHRPTLFSKDPALNGCESCHGPGGDHVESGDPAKIINPAKLKTDKASTICMKCHTNEHVTLWRTSRHARAKISCVNCHDPHVADEKALTRDIANGKEALEGLTRSIHQVELEANTAATEKDKEAELTKAAELRKQAEDTRDALKVNETAFHRVAEPYICYNCHKAQQAQVKMVTHHPISEGKVKCTDCHNPHGGPNGMLNQESVNETCFKCHPEKLGPFTFEHPPVVEDCTICHNPHGSVQDNLLVQSEPMVCLKCHAAPHNRGTGAANPLRGAAPFAKYYNNCASCHSQVHGSNENSSFHF